jgi:LPXTG-motif cell wall-anchored protein
MTKYKVSAFSKMTDAKPRFPALGMSPAVWGPIFWATMHIVSLGYPAKPSEEDKAGAAAFYNSLANVIPCPICKTHYRVFLKQTPVEGALNSRHELIHWVFDLHNNVNEQLGKPSITFQEYVAHMQSLAAAPYTKLPSTSSSTNLFAIAAIVGIAGAGYYFYTRNK